MAFHLRRQRGPRAAARVVVLGAVRMCKKRPNRAADTVGAPLESPIPAGSGERSLMADVEPDEFMARLGPRDREELVRRGRQRRWPAGASLFLEGESCSTVVIVMSGRVKVFSLTEHGEEIVLAVRGPGALLGELSAVDGAPRSASVSALEPVVALVRADRGVHRVPAPHGAAGDRAAADGHRPAARLRPQARRVRRLRHRRPGGPAAGGAGRAVRRARRARGADRGGAVPGRAGRLGRRLPGGGGQGAAGAAHARLREHRAGAP